ncbi:iron ABC transporter permease [Marispirochaeta sp.]|uniref:FecCD family ABC transporter permease n=1 Tax=Marispirochaeta sp. TaxID=2038653 RepID=UPI0029C61F9A|nr:iron ABC transporter permease [Marispirochaeta sp.]
MTITEIVVPEYGGYIRKKRTLTLSGAGLLVVVFLVSLSLGSVSIPLRDVAACLLRTGTKNRWETIILQIRLPQTLAAVAAGAGLAVAGVAMQSILRNPLGSPFTLGISNAAAFGAAFSVMILGTGVMQSSAADAVSVTNPWGTTFAAFASCMIAAGIILAVAHIKYSSPEVMVLTGVALGSLFSAGTMFLQYFADDTQLAAIVFWTFGDLARASWRELFLIGIVTFLGLIYFFMNRWNYNALSAGDETARSLGVPVGRIRLAGMTVASLMTAVIISFVGIIGFVGLICPHIVRRLVGDDHRYLMPASALTGAILLLVADTTARLILAPHVLPVAVLTSFAGAPLFLYLLIRGYK